MKNKLKIAIPVAIIISIIIFLALPSNKYLRTALYYGNVNIDDYKIFSNRVIEADSIQPWKLASNYNKSQIGEPELSIAEDLKTVAFVVIKDSQIVHESYFRGYNSSSLSNSFSAAKSIVGLLIGCALDDGAIKSLDEPVANYIEVFKKESNNKLTIKQLLTMSSGLNWDEKYNSPFSFTTQAYYGDDIRKLVTGLTVVDEPGKQFKYLSSNSQLLALVIEKATGKRLANYASEKLWRPLGASSNALWCLDKPNGTEKAYCCFNTNARDFARIGQLVLNKGKWNGKQIVSEKYIEEMTTPASWLQDEWGNVPLQYYGYHWWIMSYKGKKVVYARGILGQYIFVIPSENMVVVRLGEKRCSLRTGNLPSDIYVWLNLAMKIVRSEK